MMMSQVYEGGVANLDVADMSYDVCQQRVAGDVEWNSKTLGGGGGNENSGLWGNLRHYSTYFCAKVSGLVCNTFF